MNNDYKLDKPFRDDHLGPNLDFNSHESTDQFYRQLILGTIRTNLKTVLVLELITSV